MRNRSQKNAETLFWNLLKTKKKGCLKQGKPLRNVRLESPQATRQNPWKTCLGRACAKAEPQQVLCASHCETAAWKMPKRCFWNLLNINKNKEKRLPQARQTFAQRKAWKPASHQTKPMKHVLGTRMRKGRTPAGFVPKPLRNRSRKNAETSLLEPTKNKEIVPKPCETAARKMPKRCFWNLLKTKKKGCLKQGKPLRNVRLESPQATRQNPWKTCVGRACEKAEPQQVLCPSHCETAARKMPKRCFWNLLNINKNKEKRLPQARQTFAQRKTWKPASHQTKPMKNVLGTRMRKSRTPAGFVPKPLRNRSRKNAETSLLEPTKNKEIVRKPLRNCSLKNPETLLLEPTKNKEKRLPQARQTFAQRKTWKPASHQTKPMKNVLGTRMRKSRTPASFVPKPLRNCSLKNPETLLLEPTKKTFGTHKKQCFGNRPQSSATTS